MHQGFWCVWPRVAGVFVGYIGVSTMLAAWPKREVVAVGGVSDNRGRNPMAARGQEFDRRMIRTKLRETREEINSEQNIITGVRRRL